MSTPTTSPAPRPRPAPLDRSGRTVLCPKCRSSQTSVMHQRAIAASPAGPAIPEHMRRWCQVCRCDWVTFDMGPWED